MTKREELANPDSCWNRALDDEMLFIVLGRDIVAPGRVRSWARKRVRIGKNKAADAQILEAYECALRMKEDYARVRQVLDRKKQHCVALPAPKMTECFWMIEMQLEHSEVCLYWCPGGFANQIHEGTRFAREKDASSILNVMVPEATRLSCCVRPFDPVHPKFTWS